MIVVEIKVLFLNVVDVGALCFRPKNGLHGGDRSTGTEDLLPLR